MIMNRVRRYEEQGTDNRTTHARTCAHSHNKSNGKHKRARADSAPAEFARKNKVPFRLSSECFFSARLFCVRVFLACFLRRQFTLATYVCHRSNFCQEQPRAISRDSTRSGKLLFIRGACLQLSFLHGFIQGVTWFPRLLGSYARFKNGTRTGLLARCWVPRCCCVFPQRVYKSKIKAASGSTF